jgi:hypothetical protein
MPKSLRGYKLPSSNISTLNADTYFSQKIPEDIISHSKDSRQKGFIYIPNVTISNIYGFSGLR